MSEQVKPVQNAVASKTVPSSAEKQAQMLSDKSRLDAAQQRAKVIRAEREREEAPRQREANFGGLRTKLGVIGSIPGHHLYWANDENGEIEQLLYEGFDFVQPDEVKMGGSFVADLDLGSRVSRYVGAKADGSPLRAYLLKCPENLWKEMERARLSQADMWDKDMMQRVEHPEQGRYKPSQLSIGIQTNHKEE